MKNIRRYGDEKTRLTLSPAAAAALSAIDPLSVFEIATDDGDVTYTVTWSKLLNSPASVAAEGCTEEQVNAYLESLAEEEDAPLTYAEAMRRNESPAGLDLEDISLDDLLAVIDELPAWDYPLGEELIRELSRRAGIDLAAYLGENNCDLTDVWVEAAKRLGRSI